ncbi:energy transducer TonB [Mucilaginibacter ginsenosidivorans]|uniref:Energy transducer TonB n=1 Tax=Mucilaginibacter ginsenosidivorans TaxID=398053 RepID=A0A5B8UPZ9_9SPHI|nr:energy transducer TonB [Mucilaginibacter ginsenosidivorans]QEC61183.1 energy transducer TonB [Mucilaginibacter ginsenosidivorans]
MLGQKLDILKQEWIDVVFTDRNKNYGAYDLRKQNGSNTSKALLIGVLSFVFVISLPTIINLIAGFIPKKEEKVKIVPVVLQPPPPVNKQKPPPPPPEPPKPKVDQVKFPPPVVKPDNEVKEQPPTVKELEVADPGQKNIKGDPNADIKIDEPVGNSDVKQVTEEDPNKIFTAVEQEPTPVNGMAAFYKYLGNNIRYPAVAKENNVQGKVFMQFVVEKDGSLTDVKVIRGIGSGCDQEAVRVLQNAPKWRPGIQNGRPVRVQYNVPISFTLQQEDQ